MTRLALSLFACTACAAHVPWPVPEGWSSSGAKLTAPGDEVTVNQFTTTEADPERAARAAWSSVHGDDKGLALVAGPVRWPPSRGWSSETSLTFSSGKTTVRAEVRGFAGTSYVVLAEGDEAALDRREAQVDAVVQGLTPKGMRDESFAGQPRRPIDVEAFDAFLADAANRLEVPGTAVALVQGGRVIYEKVLGVRELGGAEPVTADTSFMVGSVTKPMTTLLEAELVDAKLFQWTTPVTKLLPDFRVDDAELTRALQLWHMSCACTGMPRQDFEYLFEYANVTPEARVASLASMKPTTKLGETFQYSNLLVAAGGFAAAHAYAPDVSLGEAYTRAMREKVFGPLGMTRSTVDFAIASRGERASPHALDLDGRPQVLPIGFEANVINIAPAGAAWSTLHDMERYALAELSRGGKVGRGERWRRRIGTPEAGYGLGMDLEKRDGLVHVGHDGGSMGFGATLLLWPELDLGLVVLTNVRNGTRYEQLPFNAAVKRKVLELVFENARPKAELIISSSLGFRADAVKRGAAVERTPDAKWLAALDGTYRHATLGTVTVKGGVLDAGEWKVRFGRVGDAMVVLDAPFAGSAMKAGDGTITLPDPQLPYVLRRE
ncbi:MAG: serine hydrolase [Myxococcaceae bacterium]|nr:serine hydrolase [Myxococcaceae bacterium]